MPTEEGPDSSNQYGLEFGLPGRMPSGAAEMQDSNGASQCNQLYHPVFVKNFMNVDQNNLYLSWQGLPRDHVITAAGPVNPTFSNLRKSCRKFAFQYTAFSLPLQRLVTRKASKALDYQAEKIANLEAKVSYLEAKLRKTITKKRKKVKPAPGKRLVRMANVRRVKRRLRRRAVYEDEASDCEVPRIAIQAEES